MNFITLNTIITDILKIIRGSKVSQSEPISKRQIEAWVHQYRAFLLKQDLDKGKMPNPDYIQEIDYLELSPIDIGGGNVVSGVIEPEYYILKSDLQIPKTIDLNHKSGLTFVGTAGGDEIQLVPQGRSRWQFYKKYTSGDPIAYLKGGYLYIENKTALQYVSVRGVFEIPPEVANFINPITDTLSYDINSVYPIPTNMLPVLKELMLKKEMGIEASAPSDIVNDSASIVSPNIEAQRQVEGE